jgi:hypothetical protein
MRACLRIKHKVLAACLIACAFGTIWLCARPGSPAKVTLSLVSYTNDIYYAWLSTNTPTAICLLSNRTGRHFFGFHGGLQVKTNGGWEDVLNSDAGEELSTQIGPHASWVIRFIPPPGASAWRCSVRLMDDFYNVPRWQKWCLDLIRRAGVKMEGKMHTIWSPELAR